MLDIKGRLLSLKQKREKEFISIIEFLTFLKTQNPNVSYPEIATFLLVELAPHDIRKTDEEFWGNEDFEEWEERNGIKVFNVPDAIDEKPVVIWPTRFFEALETIRDNPRGLNPLKNKQTAKDYLKEEQKKIFIDRTRIENILGIKTIDEDKLNKKYDNERVIAISMALTKTEEFVKNTDINKSPTGLAERIVYENRLAAKSQQIDELQARITELENQKQVETQKIAEPKQVRIQKHHRALFALLVKKNYKGFDTRNSLFNAINADLKLNGITSDETKFDTYNKLIDDKLFKRLEIFPNKKR